MTYLLLWSDALIYLLLVVLGVLFLTLWRQPHVRQGWQRVGARKLGVLSLLILALYSSIAVLDSIHFTVQSGRVVSALDILLSPLDNAYEKTYSAPMATHLFTKLTEADTQGFVHHHYQKLVHISTTYQAEGASLTWFLRLLANSVLHSTFWALVLLASVCLLKGPFDFKRRLKRQWHNTPGAPRRFFWLSVWGILTLMFLMWEASREIHLFGTNQIGQDVFYVAVKGIRTGMVIGTLTTLVMLPLAIALGLLAGYRSGLVDDVIQYIYTTLNSIPGVLLIAACVLSLQVYIAHHEALFPTLMERADIRLLALCGILGVTSWTGLCRLLRAETLKVKAQDYVAAAKVLGTSHTRILWRHILPNVMHLIIIALVIDFSGLVLAEAVLTYVGAGVDPTTLSWGNMINGARLELARTPIVWWPMTAAFSFMFILVLAANVFADCVRDAFDPRIREGAHE